MISNLTKGFLILAIGFSVASAENINYDSLDSLQLTQKAVVKLIDENSQLTDRVEWLEKQVDILLNKNKGKVLLDPFIELRKYSEFTLELPVYFTPYGNSFIRKYPTPSSVSLKTAHKGKKYEIKKIACYKNIGFWGKNKDGWIFISNPKYGKLTNIDSEKKLSLRYENWCK